MVKNVYKIRFFCIEFVIIIFQVTLRGLIYDSDFEDASQENYS